MSRPRTTALPQKMRKIAAIGIRAQFTAMTGILRCIVAKPRVLPASSRFVLNPNDRRKTNKTNQVDFRRLSIRMTRFIHVLVVVLRLIVGVAALQITGIPHVAADVIATIENDDEHAHGDENCPNDDDGRQCPPGCPSCHCTHAMSALPVILPSTVFDPLVPIEIAVAPYAMQGPPTPEPLTLYRPPRTIRASI